MLLNQKHNIYIQEGALYRKRLRATTQRLITKPQHTYIFSPPGLGKTYTIEDTFSKNATPKVDIKGNTSLWGFIVDMAQIVLDKPKDQEIIVFVDDCDTLLANTDSVNTLKIMLADDKIVYRKALGAQYAQLEEDQQYALDQFRDEGRNGVEIPLQGITVVWCSNYKLADQKMTANVKSETKAQKYMHEEALRRRMRVLDYDVEGDIKWGWIADCVLNESPPSMSNATDQERDEILYWMHSNWDNLKEHNISFAEKLYDEMVTDPDGYSTIWELDYLV
jgi:hypothetical protein